MNNPTWDPLNGGSITPNVRNEFGTLKTAILFPIATPELYAAVTNQSFESIDEEFRGMHHNPKHRLLYAHQQSLKDRGVRIVHPHHPNLQPTLNNMSAYVGPDMYCRDFLGVVDETAILSTIFGHRNNVRGHYRRIMEQIPKERQSECDTPLSWGNALLTHDSLLVGLEHPEYLENIYGRLDPAVFFPILNAVDARNHGIRAMRQVLSNIESTRQLAICSLKLNTDLDTVVAPLPRRSGTDPRVAMVSDEGVHPESFPTLKRLYDKLIVCPDPWAKLGCNILWLDPETPLVAEEARQTTLLLRSLGYNVQTRPVAALKNDSIGEKNGQPGGWRCVTGVLERANDYDFD